VPLEGSLDAEAIHLAAKLAALCAEAGIMFQTHANEHLAAVERSLVARGQRPIQLLHRLGVLGPQTLLEASQRVAFGLPEGISPAGAAGFGWTTPRRMVPRPSGWAASLGQSCPGWRQTTC